MIRFDLGGLWPHLLATGDKHSALWAWYLLMCLHHRSLTGHMRLYIWFWAGNWFIFSLFSYFLLWIWSLKESHCTAHKLGLTCSLQAHIFVQCGFCLLTFYSWNWQGWPGQVCPEVLFYLFLAEAVTDRTFQSHCLTKFRCNNTESEREGEAGEMHQKEISKNGSKRVIHWDKGTQIIL